MSQVLDMNGTLTSSDSSCAVSGTTQLAKQLSLGSSGCTGGVFYEAVVSSSKIINSATAIDLDCLDALTAIEFLYMKSASELTVRFDAIGVIALAVGGSYPTGFAGSETLTTVLDGVSVLTTFDAADQSNVQVASRINAAMALNGFSTPIVSVVNGQLRFDGVATAVNGSEGTITFSGATTTQLGLDNPTVTNAQGKDIIINGNLIIEFPKYPNAPTKFQAYGSSVNVDIVAAGRST
jgi:hypothetical protein